MIKITFLGTSAMMPTKERNHSSIFLSYKNEGILIDCGEGTQRQLRIAKIPPSKITKVLISHWHGDHVLGLPGLIQNLGANNYNKTLEIYGPKDSKKYLKNMLSGVILKDTIDYEVKEISGKFFENDQFTLTALALEHNTPCLGYIFQEKDKLKMNLPYLKKFGLTQDPLLGKLQQGKDITFNGKKITVKKATKRILGKKIGIVMDTAPCKNVDKIAKNSDLLILESTWASELNDIAIRRKHLTSELAAKIAKKNKVKELVLTHFSQRYNNTNLLEKEAKKIFKKTKLAKDFMEIEI